MTPRNNSSGVSHTDFRSLLSFAPASAHRFIPSCFRSPTSRFRSVSSRPNGVSSPLNTLKTCSRGFVGAVTQRLTRLRELLAANHLETNRSPRTKCESHLCAWLGTGQ